MNKILFFASSPGQNVLGYHLSNICLELKDLGCDIVVISGENEQVDGLSIKLDNNGLKHFILPEINSYEPIKFFKSIKALKYILQNEKIDIVHTNGLVYLLKILIASKLTNLNVSTLIHIHSCIPYYMKKKIFIKIINHMVDKFVTVCDRTSKYLVKSGISSKKVMNIENGINYIDYKSLKSEYSVPELENYYKNSNIVACVATLHPWKGHIYYIEAAKDVLKIFPNTIFLIIGDGPLKDYLKEKIKYFNIKKNFIFTGQINVKDLPNLLRKVDIGISCSLKEQFPINILELMSFGIPVIATDVGCVDRIIDHGDNGYLVPPKNSKLLAKYLIDLLSDSNKRKNLGFKGQDKIEMMYSSSDTAKKIKKVYEIIKSEKNDSKKK